MQNLLLNLFGKAMITEETKISFEDANKVAIIYGYIIHPDLCTLSVLDFVESTRMDLSTTFYQKWGQVISSTRLELLIDQLKHYASTYGTNFEGTPYLPGERENFETMEFTKFKVISPISELEVIERIEKMLFSGIALAEDTMNDLLSILDNIGHEIDVDKIKNKEAKMKLCAKLNQLPCDPIEMMRFLCYLATNKTILIKDRATIKTIENSSINITEYVKKFGVERLSSVFYRFKPLFLAFKRSSIYNAAIVNVLRRLAVKNHKPMKLGYFESLLTKPQSVYLLDEKLKEITTFKKITLLQTIMVRLKDLNTRAYVIRNQKIFMSYAEESLTTINKTYLKLVAEMIRKSIIDSLKEKACKISLPQGIKIAVPTSEKSFIGNFPIGSCIDLSASDAVIGINWKESDGARDLDLSLLALDGVKYGWNDHYSNDGSSIVYSGDMTSAYPEATELFYASSGFIPCMVNVNLFSGNEGSKFKFFVAKQKFTDLKINPMVDPNSIVFQTEMEMDSKQKIVGVITQDHFILAELRSGSARVSRVNDKVPSYTEHAMNVLDCYVYVNDLLQEAGFEITDKNPDLDLTDLSKDSLINLFS